MPKNSRLTRKLFGFSLKIYKCPESNAGRGPPPPLNGPGAERRAIAPRQGGTPVGVGFGTLRNFQTKYQKQNLKIEQGSRGASKKLEKWGHFVKVANKIWA